MNTIIKKRKISIRKLISNRIDSMLLQIALGTRNKLYMAITRAHGKVHLVNKCTEDLG